MGLTYCNVINGTLDIGVTDPLADFTSVFSIETITGLVSKGESMIDMDQYDGSRVRENKSIVIFQVLW